MTTRQIRERLALRLAPWLEGSRPTITLAVTPLPREQVAKVITDALSRQGYRPGGRFD